MVNVIEILKKIKNSNLFYYVLPWYFISCLITLTMFDKIYYFSFIASIVRYFSYFTFALYCFISMVDLNSINSLRNILLQIIYFFKEHLILLFSITLAGLIFISSRNKAPFFLVILLWTCGQFDINKIINIFLYTNAVGMFTTVFAQNLNIIPDITIMRENGITRYSMGYIYPLEFMVHYLFLVLLYVYLKNERYNYKDFLLINFINVLLFKITDARTSFIIITIFSFIALIVKHISIDWFKKLFKVNYLYCIVFIIAISSIVLSIFYNPNIDALNKLNQLMSGRLLLANKAFNEYGFTLFGESIKWIGSGTNAIGTVLLSDYNFVDCSYMKNSFDYGIIFLIFTLIVYCVILKKQYNEKKIIGIIAILAVLVVSVLEPRLVQYEINAFILLGSSFIVIENKEISKL